MGSAWINDGKLVISATERVVLCDTCPCGCGACEGARTEQYLVTFSGVTDSGMSPCSPGQCAAYFNGVSFYLEQISACLFALTLEGFNCIFTGSYTQIRLQFKGPADGSVIQVDIQNSCGWDSTETIEWTEAMDPIGPCNELDFTISLPTLNTGGLCCNWNNASVRIQAVPA